MKILDKKGRLFGVINIIDLVVILLLVGILIVGFGRRDTGIVSQAETKEALVTYEVQEIRQITVDQIKVGDPLYHYDKGTYIGEIVNVEVKPFTEKVDHRGEWIDAEVPNRYVAEVQVKATIEENDLYYTVGGEQTRVGAQFRLKNKNFTSFGFCVAIDIIE